MFTDSIDENVELLRELVGGIPPESRRRAKRAAVTLENWFTKLQKEYPNDPVVALGAAFAVMMLAQRLVEAPKQGDSDKGLIQLLS
ncbi:MAG: hypothetical protein ACLPOA_24280 [Methylocella sp.]|jgi:hypothetical protein